MKSWCWPLLETKQEWVVHGFSYPRYLTDLGSNAQSEIFKKSSVDHAMRDAFRKMKFFPVGDEIRQIVVEWINYLRQEKLWGFDDPLFPATKLVLGTVLAGF